ncbi:hypothetical protein LINPERPRIM_LOCUS19275, partial [Linum perenne]
SHIILSLLSNFLLFFSIHHHHFFGSNSNSTVNEGCSNSTIKLVKFKLKLYTKEKAIQDETQVI